MSGEYGGWGKIYQCNPSKYFLTDEAMTQGMTPGSYLKYQIGPWHNVGDGDV